MIFENYTLEDPLKEFVESIFYYKGYKPDHSIERVVPTGNVFILFELDGIERNTFENKSLKINGRYTKVWISGMHKNYLSISAPPDSEMLAIQFKPSGAYPFLNNNVSELNNKVVSAEELFGNEILSLREQIISEKTVLGKFSLVEKWLLKQLDKSKTATEEILIILNQLKIKSVSENKEIIATYSNSQKHLIHQFKKYFGLTPKVFHRIFRFNHILKQIQNKQSLKWTDIAYEFGFSDQSHFIKEFKEFSGFNPKEFINADFHKQETNFFPVDR